LALLYSVFTNLGPSTERSVALTWQFRVAYYVNQHNVSIKNILLLAVEITAHLVCVVRRQN